ncbi:MAG: TrkA family potassium uptake protein [Oscillospiraceae bacterium]|nr:TrkA family potassium uptake protein [Oscillospiraceae bacterium]
MKSFLIIGLGTFGHHLCRELAKQKCEIMIVDSRPEVLEDLLPYVVSAKIADCSNEEVLRSFDIPSFDACFVCIGGNFQYSLEITSLLKDLGARKIFSKADEDIQAKFLRRIGADEVIYPELDAAASIAISESNDSIFDCIPLSGEFSVYEIEPNEKWLGKTIRELNFRNTYNLNILGAVQDGMINDMPSIDYVFKRGEHLLVMGRDADIRKAVG